jgi:hypothetical protein
MSHEVDSWVDQFVAADIARKEGSEAVHLSHDRRVRTEIDFLEEIGATGVFADTLKSMKRAWPDAVCVVLAPKFDPHDREQREQPLAVEFR